MAFLERWRPMIRYSACLLIAILFSGTAFADGENCRLLRYASLPITMDSSGGATVPMSIAGSTVNMLVDTGAVFSTLDEYTVQRLKLTHGMIPRREITTMFGGQMLYSAALVPEFQIGKLVVDKHYFPVMQDGSVSFPEDGLLGTDITAAFDLDFDFVDGKLNLVSQNHCAGAVVYWTKGEYAVVPFEMGDQRHINIDVMLDGRNVRAIVDTGSSRSIMSLDAAEDIFGLDDTALNRDGNQHAFGQLMLQGVSVSSPDISLIPDNQSRLLNVHGGPVLILGMDVLRQLHLYIAYGEHKLYATPASAH